VTSPAHEPPDPRRFRHVAENFGADAERYERARPRYPQAMIDRIVAATPRPAAPDASRAPGALEVLDVGCGTGIAARQFAAAGCRVLGVDPDARMAEVARGTGIGCEVARFEEWDPAGRTFDLVTAGQAWHWVDMVAGADRAAQVLRPGGRLALFWNVAQTSPELGRAFTAVYREVMPEAPVDWERPAIGLYAAGFAKAADGIRQTGAFGEPEEWRFTWEHTYTRDEWADQVATHGFANRLPEDRLARLRTGVAAAIDAAGGTVTMGYTTAVVTAARTTEG
jgi:SAM-dependent methyltransferase